MPRPRPRSRRSGSSSAGAVAAPHGTMVVSVSDPDDEVRTVIRMVVDALREGVAARSHGDPVRCERAVRAARARAAHGRGDPAQRRRGAHSRRKRARADRCSRLLAALRPRLPPPRRDGVAGGCSDPCGVVSFRRTLGAHQPPGRHRARRRALGGAARTPRWRARAPVDRRAGGARSGAPSRLVHARARRPRAISRPSCANCNVISDAARTRERRGASSSDGRRSSYSTTSRAHARGRAGPTRSSRRPTRSTARSSASPASTRWKGRPGLDVFRRALVMELDEDLGRVGRLGDGVLMGHVGLGLGLDLERVYVCGLAEGTFPARVRDDSLLPDTDRRADGRCAPAARRRGRRRPRAACWPRSRRRAPSGCCSSPVAISVAPPSACRRVSSSTPSKRSMARAATPTISSTSTPTGTRRSRRSRQGSRVLEFPATEQEYRMRALLDHCGAGGGGRRARAVAARRRARTGLDCDAGPRERRGSPGSTATSRTSRSRALTADDAVVSPTRSGVVGRSPHDYLMQQILRVEIPELPEEVYELSPLDRGSLVHEALDEFIREVLDRPGGAPGSRRAVDRRRPGPAARDRRAALRRVPGRGLHRPAASSGTATASDSSPTSTGSSTEDSELRAEPRAHHARDRAARSASATTSGRRSRSRCPTVVTLRFRGPADRVDTPHRRHRCSSLDYKTGKSVRALGDARRPTSAAARSSSSPCTRCAARAAFGDRRHSGRRRVLVREHAGRVPLGRARARRRTSRPASTTCSATIVDGIEHGVFPAGSTARARGSGPWRSFETPTAPAPATATASGSATPRAGARRSTSALADRRLRRAWPSGSRAEARTTRSRTTSTPERSLDARRRRRARRSRRARPRRTLFVEAGAGTGKTTVARATASSGCSSPRRACRAARSWRSPSPRRPPPSCATASAASSSRPATRLRADPRSSAAAPRRARRARRRRHHHAARASRSASWPSTRSRPACRPRSRCVDEHRRRSSRSTSGGRASSTGCSTTRRSSARLLLGRARSALTLDTLRDARRRAATTNWDLVAGRACTPSPTRRPFDLDAGASPTSDGLSRARRPSARTPTTSCRWRSSAMCRPWLERSRTPPDEYEQLRLLVALGACRAPAHEGRGEGRTGRRRAATSRRCATRWPRLRDDGEARARRHRATRAPPAPGRSRSSRSRRPTSAAAPGRLEFHDLLVLARDVLRDPSTAGRCAPLARALHAPAARRVPGHRPDPGRARGAASPSADPDGAATGRGTRSSVEPGRLFVVGDPKQSIYRFRRADIAAFLRARARVRGGAAAPHPQLPHRSPGHRVG